MLSCDNDDPAADEFVSTLSEQYNVKPLFVRKGQHPGSTLCFREMHF